MDNQTQAEPVTSSKNIRTLMAVAADRVGEKVTETRRGLATALHGGEKVFGLVKERAVKNVRGTDMTLRTHPYEALAITLGIGTLIGYLFHLFSQTHKAGSETQP